jgi:glutamate dehydrogenase (NADP+)
MRKESSPADWLYENEKDYLQTVQEWLEMISPAIDRNPKYVKRISLRDGGTGAQMVSFLSLARRYKGNYHTNHGYRVQFNSATALTKAGFGSFFS